MSQVCDILIIGGGVVGCAAAFYLARRRASRVVLLEKAFLGAGASGKAAGLVCRHLAASATAEMARKGLDTFSRFGEVVGGPSPFTPAGMVLVVKEADRAALEADVARGREAGVGVRSIGAQELMEIDANVRLADDEAAAFEAGAGAVDVVQAIGGLAEASRRRQRVDVRQGVEVKAVLAEKGLVIGAETNEGRYECRTVVLAAGAWSPSLARGLKAALPVTVGRRQAALFRRPLDCGRRGVVCTDFVQGLYFKPAGDLIEAGALACEPETTGPDDANGTVDGEWLAGVRQRLCRRCPGMHRAYGRGGYAALAAVTPDGQPILDRLPDLDGAYAAVGFDGPSLVLAPAAGQLLAELILDGTTTAEAQALRLARFEDAGAAPA
jgi:glycine/D-amino acid oxidase-like deaminating enzyme